MEDIFGDPDTPVAKKNIDFHHPLPGQLDKIMHEIKGGIYHEDSGTHSDMDSLSSEADVKLMKEEGRECYEMVDDSFSIVVGGFAISCESDEKINAKKNDYMYEIGTKCDEREMKPVKTSSISSKRVGNEIKTSENFDSSQEAVSLPPPAPPAPPTVRPRSAPTFSSLQQRRSSRIQLKSFSTTALPPHQPVIATVNQEEKLTYYKSVASMSEQFPKWLYSEVVKAGLQFSKPGFLRSNSSSSLSSSSSDPESNMDDGTATDSSDQQEMMQAEEAAADDSGTTHNANTCVSSTTQESMEQFHHYEAICYLWRGRLLCYKNSLTILCTLQNGRTR